MKLASVLVHAKQFSPGSSWLIVLPEKGWLLGCESCFCFGLDWTVFLKAWLLSLKGFIDSVKMMSNQLGSPISTCLS